MRGEVGSASLLNVRLKGNNNKIKKRKKSGGFCFVRSGGGRTAGITPSPQIYVLKGWKKRERKARRFGGERDEQNRDNIFIYFIFFSSLPRPLG